MFGFHTASSSVGPANTTSLGTFSVISVNEPVGPVGGSVAWSYSLDNGAAQHLAEGQTEHETYTITVSDNLGASATQDVTVTITGTNDGPDAVDDHLGGGHPRVAVFGGTDGTSPVFGSGNVANDLQALGIFDSVAVLNGSESLATLQGYDAVLAYTNGYGQFFDFGNTLASYVDGGGHLVAATFAYQGQPGGTEWGRLETEG
jgi:VCBS repeat-containing protein